MAAEKNSIRLLVDTNIWIDNYLCHRPGYESACKFIYEATQRTIALTYPSTSAKDVYYAVCTGLKQTIRSEKGSLTETDALACNEIAWRCIQNMMDIATAAPISEAEMWLACRYKKLHSDFEDDLVLASAETSKATYLVTSDKKLLGKSPLPAFTPDDMLTFLKR